jgi:protease-4
MMKATLRRLQKLARFNPVHLILRGWRSVQNRWRLRDTRIDYVMISLPALMPALPERRGWLQRRILGSPPMSLWAFDKLLQRIADDPRPKGVIVRIDELAMGLADLRTLRMALQRFRKRGKRLVAFAQGYTLRSYYIASACDCMVLQPTGQIDTLGLRQQVTMLKDSLDSLGIALDVVAITPFKGALDSLSRSQMSPEARAQMDWLLDSHYEILVSEIAEGRSTTPEAVRQMIDTAPHLDSSALKAGYVDAVCHEEGLPEYLDAAHVIPWATAQQKLIVKYRKRPQGPMVAVLPISGLMIPGESGAPPVSIPLPFIGEARAGDRTIVQQIRQIQKQEQIAAVVLYIDSGGGAVTAAEAMTAALEELAKTRPVVVYMHNVAASGGYYIATPARWVVAQPNTITGSIGVITAKLVTDGLLQRIRANTIELTRGANADLYSTGKPFTDLQRTQIRGQVEHLYAAFVARVAAARSMDSQAVDAVGGGRVWTGAQALEHGLIDELGDLRAAIDKARVLAALPASAPTVLWNRNKGRPLPPLPVRSNTDALTYAIENLGFVTSGEAQMLMDKVVEWTGR